MKGLKRVRLNGEVQFGFVKWQDVTEPAVIAWERAMLGAYRWDGSWTATYERCTKIRAGGYEWGFAKLQFEQWALLLQRVAPPYRPGSIYPGSIYHKTKLHATFLAQDDGPKIGRFHAFVELWRQQTCRRQLRTQGKPQIWFRKIACYRGRRNPLQKQKVQEMREAINLGGKIQQ